MGWFGLLVRHKAGRQKDLGSNLLWLSSLFKICGLWTLILLPTVNDTLKWLSSLPALMQNPTGGDSVVLGMVSLFPHFLGTQSPLGLCGVSAPLWRQLGIKQV